jgi:hypothetical protein
MKNSRPSLILFTIAALLVMVAKIFELDQMMLIVKPIVGPAIYFYYLQTRKKRKTNLLFSTAIWSFFVADMVIILYPTRGITAIMVCCMISYLILIKFAIEDCKKIKINSFNLVMTSLSLLLLSYVVYSLLVMSMDKIVGNFPLYLLYGIILVGLGIISVINYLSNTRTTFSYFCIMALCMIASDFFFCIHSYIVKMPLIDHINLFAQFVSYYFMVKYFNSRKVLVRKESKIKSV